MSKNLILASQSPFRKAQLEQLGFTFDTLSPDLDERGIESQWQGPLNELPAYLSVEKAKVVAQQKPDSIVIGSDQMLIFEDRSYSKPETLEDCMDRLKTLQGKTHELHTGLCVINGDQVRTSTTIARLTMRPLTDEEIKNYVTLDKPLGCAGGYKIEQNGLHLFDAIQTNDHSSIVGLPLLSLVSILRQWGISIL